MQQNNTFNVEEQIKELVNEVIAGVRDDWSMIYKIRYIYLEIGKRFYKDVDFFFSADGKLGEVNLSIPEIKDIYNSNLGRKVGKYLRVICKSASYILKLAYDKIGIPTELIETNTTIKAMVGEEEFLIYHWFLAIHNTEDNETYFATLTPDLPYIQMNMDTRHFGSDIPYKRNYNGKLMQIYKGDEIKHSIISRERLKEIDIAIGYIKNNYHYNDKGQLDNKWLLQYDSASLDMLRDVLKNNQLFYKLEIMETSFYKEKYTVVEHRHISGRDPSDVYIIKLDDMSKTETLDTSKYDDGYTHQARELVRIIDSTVIQNMNVKTKVYKNQKFGHKLVIVYNVETRYYTVYFITF